MHIVIESMVAISAKNAIARFNIRLLVQLPLESDVFFAMVKQACLFPRDAADRIAELSTRSKKVSYFLQHVIEPEADVYLPKLLGVMKESEDLNVVQLANEIQAAMESGIFAYGVDKYICMVCRVHVAMDNFSSCWCCTYSHIKFKVHASTCMYYIHIIRYAST